MMTNEELAGRIRSGRTEHYADLWDQVERFVNVKANDYLHGQSVFRGVTHEDLMQAGFLAMVAAVNGYDPDSGAGFTTYLSFHLISQFNAAAGMRTARTQNDPIDSSISLDQPAFDEGEDTLGDCCADPVDHFADADEKIQNEQLHEALEKALGELPEGEADILRMKFYQQMTVTALAELKGKSYNQINTMIARALNQLRRGAKKNGLHEFIEDRTNYYRRSNFRTSQTSPVEWLVLKRIEVEEKYRNSIQK